MSTFLLVGLVQVLATVFWMSVIISWSMCLYISLASREGLKWFSFRLNPYLISLCLGGLALKMVGPSTILYLLSPLVSSSSFLLLGAEMQGDSSSSSTPLLEWCLQPSQTAVTLATGCYSFYAILVTLQHIEFRQYRYIIAVNIPMATKLAWTVYLSLTA